MAESLEKRWYVATTYSGYEDSVEKDIRKRIESMDMSDYIFDVVVPKEIVKEQKANGQIKEKEKKIYPGYVFVQMIVTDESWFIVRNTPKVTGILGSSGQGAKPVPLSKKEEAEMLKRAGIAQTIKLDYEVGDMVVVTSGSMVDNIVQVIAIDFDNNEATVEIEMFGRPVEMTVDLQSLKKAN